MDKKNQDKEVKAEVEESVEVAIPSAPEEVAEVAIEDKELLVLKAQTSKYSSRLLAAQITSAQKKLAKEKCDATKMSLKALIVIFSEELKRREAKKV